MKHYLTRIFILCFSANVISANNSYSQNTNQSNYETANEYFENIKLLIENSKDFSESLDAINLIKSNNPKLFGDAAPLTEYLGAANRIATFINAVQNDAEKAIKNNDTKLLWNGEAIHELKNITVDVAFDKFIDAWEHQKDMKNLGSTFGADEFVKAFVHAAHDKRWTIDTWTNVLDGCNQMSWGLVGYYYGNAVSGGNQKVAYQYAKAYQQISGIAAHQFRDKTMPFFAMITGADKNELKAKVLENYYVLQNKRMKEGLTIQHLDDAFSIDELKRNGFTRSDVLGMNEQATNWNINLIKAREDITPDFMSNYESSSVKVGGVAINPKIDYTKDIPDSISIKAIKTERPSQDSLYWNYDSKK